MAGISKVSGSFRDPSGFVFLHNGVIYRAVASGYRDHYDRLMESGLYGKLVGQGLLIPHEEVSIREAGTEGAYKVLRPAQVPFISYPYEWCFAQLRDAARSVLKIQKTALDFGMSLKDASAFNVQFVGGVPCLIDTLSFEPYQPGRAWVAYRQFVEHFLAPLALASMQDPIWIKQLQVRVSGIPIRTAHNALPIRSWWKFGIFLHVHMQALSMKLAGNRRAAQSASGRSFRKESFYGLIESLTRAVASFREPKQTEGWKDYYQSATEPGYLEAKTTIVEQYLREARASTVWDLGANDGSFSRMAAAAGARVVSIDSDHACVSDNYKAARSGGLTSILPLWIDLANPTPNAGWDNAERSSLQERGPADLALALALIHHLAIGNNVPLPSLAQFFAKLCRMLIIEFVPKTDRRVQQLLSTREDIFPDYNRGKFEEAFAEKFTTLRCAEIAGSERVLYLMKKNEA